MYLHVVAVAVVVNAIQSQVLLKDPVPLMYHGEIVWRDGVRVGDVRAASYGHTLGGAVGLAMVRAPSPSTATTDGSTTTASSATIPVVNKAFLTTGTWEIEVNGKKYPAVASLNPMYDPNNKRIKM